MPLDPASRPTMLGRSCSPLLAWFVNSWDTRVAGWPGVWSGCFRVHGPSTHSESKRSDGSCSWPVISARRPFSGRREAFASSSKIARNVGLRNILDACVYVASSSSASSHDSTHTCPRVAPNDGSEARLPEHLSHPGISARIPHVNRYTGHAMLRNSSLSPAPGVGPPLHLCRASPGQLDDAVRPQPGGRSHRSGCDRGGGASGKPGLRVFSMSRH